MKSIASFILSWVIFHMHLRVAAVAQSTDENNPISQIDIWRECSLDDANGRDWSICLQPTGYGPLWYCPTANENVDPISNASELEDIFWYGRQTNFLPCFECPSPETPHGSTCNETLTTLAGLHNLKDYDTEVGMEFCADLCESGVVDDVCSSDSKCTAGSHFCDYANDDESSGVCKECPYDISDCAVEGFLGSVKSGRECAACRLFCVDVGESTLEVDGEGFEVAIIERAVQEQYMTASGPLVDCSDLILADVETCDNARGSVCLVEDYTFDTLFFELSEKAESNGCVAIIKFADTPTFRTSQHSHDRLGIPFVDVSYKDGRRLRDTKLGSTARVASELYGSSCYPSWDTACSDSLPCQESNTYCNFRAAVEDGEYVEGYCHECPTDWKGDPDPAACFFSREQESSVTTQKEVESCARSCNANLNFEGCKFCPDDVSAFNFGVDKKEDQCSFCPDNDITYEYRERYVPLFGENITCWNMQAFFERFEVDEDSENCQLAQSMNYICGCKGSGYAGADTEAKRNALVWVPRVMAILSGLGSTFVLVDVLRVKKRRSNVFHQLMAQISFFDIIGSIAYSFTSLPIPTDYYFQGSRGNEASCTAQGFFIQVGTVACYTNVSLAFYYYFVIRMGWTETRLKRIRVWFFACPIVVGLTFAFAGIPFYDNMLLWCNNTDTWWPDIPVAIAILVATVVMGAVYHAVHKKHRASNRWRSGGGGGGGDSMSTRVFWQSFWYLMAFYMTWPPYLALQYSWSSGKAFGNYGLILYAGTAVPLQGAWNFFVYARNRQLKALRESTSKVLSTAATRASAVLTRRSITASDRISTAVSRASAVFARRPIGVTDTTARRCSSQVEHHCRCSKQVDQQVPTSPDGS